MWLNEQTMPALKKKTNLSQECKIHKLLSQRELGLIKKGKHLQTTTASHFHLKLILEHAVQVISHVKMHKNIIPHHNQMEYSFFHFVLSYLNR